MFLWNKKCQLILRGLIDVKKLKEIKEKVSTNVDQLHMKPSTFKKIVRSTHTTQNFVVVGGTKQMKDPHSLMRILEASLSRKGDTPQLVKRLLILTLDQRWRLLGSPSKINEYLMLELLGLGSPRAIRVLNSLLKTIKPFIVFLFELNVLKIRWIP